MSKYFIPGTKVLKNKLNEQNQVVLNALESDKSMKALLTNLNLIQSFNPMDLETLKKIHYIMFNEIYDWAGEYRTENISKGAKLFHPHERFGEAIKLVSDELSGAIEFIDVMEIYNDINHMHPFREGNGRATRVWINLILEKTINKQIDWSLMLPKDYLEVMKADSAEVMVNTFEKYLVPVDHQNYASSFMKHNIGSYAYEGEYFSDEQIEELEKLQNQVPKKGRSL